MNTQNQTDKPMEISINDPSDVEKLLRPVGIGSESVTGAGNAQRLTNMRLLDNENPPLMRQFKFAEILTKPGTGSEKGKRFKWVYWYWHPISEAGQYDCGFSGVREGHPQFNEIRALLGA